MFCNEILSVRCTWYKAGITILLRLMVKLHCSLQTQATLYYKPSLQYVNVSDRLTDRMFCASFSGEYSASYLVSVREDLK